HFDPELRKLRGNDVGSTILFEAEFRMRMEVTPPARHFFLKLCNASHDRHGGNSSNGTAGTPADIFLHYIPALRADPSMRQAAHFPARQLGLQMIALSSDLKRDHRHMTFGQA